MKRGTKILVVLGNPPYNGFAGVAVEEERELTSAYKTTKRAPAPQGQGLNDLYVRFYRMAEHRIAEMTGKGIICFISNYSWLDGLSFTGMRESYLEKFDRIWIDCLNGDKYKTGKVTPDGKPDPSVFSTEWNHEGIQVGTAIGLLLRKQISEGTNRVKFEHFWGRNKRLDLLQSLRKSTYRHLSPAPEIGLPFLPAIVGEDYGSWPTLTDLLPISFPGVKTSRDKLLIDFDKEALARRIEAFLDPRTTYQDWNAANPDLAERTNGFDPSAVRQYLVERGFKPQNIVRYQYRPFDARWVYWESETNLLDRKREDYFPHVDSGNIWIEARQKQPMEHFDRGFVTRLLGDNFGNGLSSFFPLNLNTKEIKGPLLSHSKDPQKTRNIGSGAERYLHALSSKSDDLFFHAVSVLNDSSYRKENGGALRQDWPRIPLPNSKEALATSAELGRQVAGLFDTEAHIKGIDSGQIRLELKLIAVTTRAGGGSLKESDLVLSAGWGYAGNGGVTMPGKGNRLERAYSRAERQAILDGASALGLSETKAFELLGQKTSDVYLNEVAYWSNIPEKVWDYTIGGYQVIKKWLSYREQPLLGRALTIDEVRYVQEMARRIAAILLLGPALDANYEAVKAHAFPWPPTP